MATSNSSRSIEWKTLFLAILLRILIAFSLRFMQVIWNFLSSLQSNIHTPISREEYLFYIISYWTGEILVNLFILARAKQSKFSHLVFFNFGLGIFSILLTLVSFQRPFPELSTLVLSIINILTLILISAGIYVLLKRFRSRKKRA